MEDFGWLWEGLVLRGAAVFVHRDGNPCRERGRELVSGEVRRYQRGCISAYGRWASGVARVGVEG